MADTELAVTRLQELKALGVNLALDDFGTGYSSLSYLSRFPVDILKMDRSFLREGATPEMSGLASAVLALGSTLNLDVVAEGIEQSEQWTSLRELGCEFGQGFFFARPMDAEAALEHLAAATALTPMHHSHEALDRPGGLARVGLLLPLRDPEFRKLWIAMCVSLLGDGAFLVAVAWQVYELSNAPTAMSVVGIAMTVPTIVFLLIGGVASDRFDRRMVMVAADLLRAVAGAALAVLALTHAIEVWHIAVIAAVYGTGAAFFAPAFDALVPDIVPPERLAQANALDQLMRPIVFRMAGPAIGGVLVASASAGVVFALDAASFIVSATILLLVRVAAIPAARGPLLLGAPRSRRGMALRARPGVALGHVRERRGRLPVLHGTGRGAAPLRGQERPRGEAHATSAWCSPPAAWARSPAPSPWASGTCPAAASRSSTHAGLSPRSRSPATAWRARSGS